MKDESGKITEASSLAAKTKNRQEGGELVFRPALRAAWFLFFGFFLGPTIIFFERDPAGHPAKWIALSFLFLGLILHRLSLKYNITKDHIKSSSWWGLKPDESLTLACIAEVKTLQGFVGHVSGCSNIEITSSAFDEAAVVMLGQPEAWKIVETIKEAAAKAKGRDDALK